MDSMSESSGWSSSDDSDIEELLEDDDTEMMVAIVAVKELQDRAMLLDRRQGHRWVARTSFGTVLLATTNSCKTTLQRYRHIHHASSVEGSVCGVNCL